ncbi:uncharacterized protein B0I36DRAFT_387436 [Microdochium trichocladiopsis]|uniref:Nephrocystin 3-like N-terminal domain-containing protein n=1 Tax=Microdochium trichocladiopsis TaxID=1682393 RepID=A0A9P9BM39_9PEZI|nr:uncharacterized protein B0I36DRAFT_387436 [Microdochium trichocladiopsis]KAH7025060.1 hypothetical protein B0I36DRAFT_387436 [Microdochium trichocladiopsis]
MSGFEAIGIACNIMQILGTAAKAVILCKSIYKGRPGTIDDELVLAAESLKAISDSMQNKCAEWKRQGDDEEKLARTAEKCGVVARALIDEVAYMTKHQAQGDLRAALKTTLTTMWRGRRLRETESSLRKCEDTMRTQLLHRICKQNDLLALKQSKAFATFDAAQRQFVDVCAAGFLGLTAFVNNESEHMRQHMTEESNGAVQAITTAIDSSAMRTRDELTRSANESRERALEQLSDQFETIRLKTYTENERQRFLKSFRYIEMNARQSAIREAERSTFDWIFGNENEGSVQQPPEQEDYGSAEEHADWDSSSEYESGHGTRGDVSQDRAFLKLDSTLWDNFGDWLKSDDKLYWISGKPGSGKSTLVKYIAQNERTKRELSGWRPNTFIVTHYFWKPGRGLQKSFKGMLLSILYQLLGSESTVLDEVMSRYKARTKGPDDHSDWSVDEASRLVHYTLKHWPNTLFFVIDGLDEAESSDSEDIMGFVHAILRYNHVKVCVASRPERMFEKQYGKAQHLRLHYLTERDMIRFFRRRIGHAISASGMPRQEQEDFEYEVVRKSSGVFLWTVLAIRALSVGLRNDDTAKELWERLRMLPEELSGLYKDMWARLNQNNALYQQRGAAYIEVLTVLKQVQNEQDPELARIDRTPAWPLIAYMGAFDPLIQNAILRPEVDLSVEHLVARIQAFGADVKKAIQIWASLVKLYQEAFQTSGSDCWRPLRESIIDDIRNGSDDYQLVDTEEELPMSLIEDGRPEYCLTEEADKYAGL